MEKITFISFCVDIDRGKLNKNLNIYRDFEVYTRGMFENIETILPLVIFTSVEDVRSNRDNLIITYFTKQTLIKEFPNYARYSECFNGSKKDDIIENLPLYAPLVVMKFKKMVDVINDNKFNSEYFFWVDSYFGRGIDTKVLTDKNVFDNKTKNIGDIVGDKFLILMYKGRPFGFFWGGHKDAVLKVYESYFNVFFEHLNNEILTEELIFKIMIERYPDLLNVVDLSSYESMYKLGLIEYLKWTDDEN